MYNKILIMGFVGRSEGLKQHNGTNVLNFSVATSKSKKDQQGQWTSTTIWHNVAIWGKSAEWLQGLKKGDLVFVEGEQDNKTYEKDGVKKSYSKINAKLVKILNKEKQQNNQNQNYNNQNNQNHYTGNNNSADMDNIPF